MGLLGEQGPLQPASAVDVAGVEDLGMDPAWLVRRGGAGAQAPADVRQILGRPGEVWGAESGVDKLVLVRTT